MGIAEFAEVHWLQFYGCGRGAGERLAKNRPRHSANNSNSNSNSRAASS